MKLTFFFRIQWSSRIYPLHILCCYASTPSRNTSFLPRESDVVQGQPVIPLSRRCGFGGWRWWDGLEVRMCKGDRDELMVSKDIRIGMVREMFFFPKSFQISEVTWVVKIHGIRMILVNLVTFHENRDTCVSVSVGILRHMLQNDGIEHYPPVCIRLPIGTPHFSLLFNEIWGHKTTYLFNFSWAEKTSVFRTPLWEVAILKVGYLLITLQLRVWCHIV